MSLGENFLKAIVNCRPNASFSPLRATLLTSSAGSRDTDDNRRAAVRAAPALVADDAILPAALRATRNIPEALYRSTAFTWLFFFDYRIHGLPPFLRSRSRSNILEILSEISSSECASMANWPMPKLRARAPALELLPTHLLRHSHATVKLAMVLAVPSRRHRSTSSVFLCRANSQPSMGQRFPTSGFGGITPSIAPQSHRICPVGELARRVACHLRSVLIRSQRTWRTFDALDSPTRDASPGILPAVPSLMSAMQFEHTQPSGDVLRRD